MSRFCWTVAACLLTTPLLAQTPVVLNVAAPELAERPESEWINSKPRKLADLRGRVVVLHFWTFGCINCIHNQPHYKSWQERYARKGVTQIGVHTPESDGERDVEQVREAARKAKLDYPIVIDGDGQIWKTWGNRWWPCTYLIDKRGVVRYRWDGELNWKEARGEELMRKRIDELLAEPEPQPEKPR